MDILRAMPRKCRAGEISIFILILALFCCSCKTNTDDRLQGKWEVIKGGSLGLAEISSMEFSNGNVYVTQNSIFGNITTPSQYSIKSDGKILVGGFIFELTGTDILETRNISLLRFKLKKVK
ncbi:MAG: hypothetical protein NTV87_16340 [Ignavibacteriae bacterium]|nr:hypothetical protein [Ignavibacteriota bacterium]